MKITGVVKQWLESEGWEDEVVVDEAAGTSLVETRIESQGADYRVYIEADENREWLTVFFYPAEEVIPEEKYEGACVLASKVNLAVGVGRFAVSEKGVVQYKSSVDLQGLSPSSESLGVMMAAAIMNFDNWLPAFKCFIDSDVTATQAFDATMSNLQG